MMKLRVFLIIIIILSLSSSIAYASFEDSVENHWCEEFIDKNFIKKYFPNLSGNDFSEFKPDSFITINEFSNSVSLLFKDYGYDTEILYNNKYISREKMISILAKEIEDIGIPIDKNVQIPFKDINTMDQNNIELLKTLYKLEIIRGDTYTQFAPKRRLSQAEAVIILQRVRGRLNNMDTISFKTLGVVQTFNGEEEIIVIPQGEKVLVTITKQFPTPGYNMYVKNIIKTKDGHRIIFNIEKPPKDSIQLQVQTYKTISLKIDKKDLGQMPYNFILDGYNKI